MIEYMAERLEYFFSRPYLSPIQIECIHLEQSL